MEIRYTRGDLIDAPEILIVHGCNTRGKYESGIAGVIRKRLPFAYHAYQAAFDDFSTKFEAGQIIWGFSIDKQGARIVGNMLTQNDYGRDPNRLYVVYDAVLMGLRHLNHFVSQTQNGEIDIAATGPIERVGFPLIGCGLGNGSWRTISQMIEAESYCYQPIVYTLDGIIPET